MVEAKIKDLAKFLQNTGMMERKIVGREFTWTNKTVHSKIDRAMVNVDWVQKMPQMEIQIKEPSFLDHTPLWLQFEGVIPTQPIPFKFNNKLPDHQEFLTIVHATWRKVGKLGPMPNVWWKLKVLKKGLKLLNTRISAYI